MRHGRRRARCVRSASQRRELTITRTARYTGSPANTQAGRPAAQIDLLSSRSLSRYQFEGGHLEAILASRRRGAAKNDRHDLPAAVTVDDSRCHTGSASARADPGFPNRLAAALGSAGLAQTLVCCMGRTTSAAAAGEGRAEHIHQTVPAIGILGMHRCSHPRDGDSGACACTLRAIEIRLPGDV